MDDEVYRQLRETMARRGRVTDIPEFYEMARTLFTPEQAEIQNAMPAGRFTPGEIAKETGKSEAGVTAILEAMADKGLCMSFVRDGTRYYAAAPLMPGIFEYQFMRGTKTDRDYEIARAINAYRKAAARAAAIPPRVIYPGTRVIPVGKTINAEAAVQTFDQVLAYVESSEPIAVTTCYCRHEALLVDENDVCGMPMEVCMQFRTTAEYLIERGIGRRVSKEEAMDIFRRAEEAGLVHVAINTQRIDFICNCCPCHCAMFQDVLVQPKPAEAMLHSYIPSFDAGLCTVCGTCVDRCPTDALTLRDGNVPDWNEDRCIGCGVCVSGCQEEAITLVERVGDFTPPLNRMALGETMMKKRAEAGF
ncbi:MAG TPA: 4Fe-4S binding protein [Dehalococcoidia bacterium]|nr:4Fe-4S binding protein [Dehalococcoidia bacterium]